MFLLQIPSVRERAFYSEAVVLATSVFVWTAIFLAGKDPVTIYSFTNGFSLTFRMDGLAALFAGMVSLMWPLVMIYAFEYMRESKRQNGFFAFFVMTFGITLGIAFSGNMITLYVFFEMLTLVTIPLVTHYGDRESMFAGRKYAAYTIGGASLAFFPVVLTALDGNAGIFTPGGILSASYDRRILLIAFLFGFFGFAAKSALFPLYDWLPVASVAPTPVTALLHAVAVVNAGVFAVARMTYYVYGADFLKGTYVRDICLAAASFSLVFGAVMALREKHFKRRLAFSTMSNLSYMLWGMMLLTTEGFAAGMLHMAFHGIIKMTLFLCAGAFMHASGKAYIYEINGIGKRMPVTFTLYTLGALSLTGIPLFCGFISKFYLITAGIAEGSAPALAGAAALMAAAFFCAMYTLTVSVRAFFPVSGTDRCPSGDVREVNALMLVPVGIFSAANILFGLHPAPIISFIRQIAEGIR